MPRRADKLDFAPSDPTDGRRRHQWQSKYPGTAQLWMLAEAIYLLVLLAGCPTVLYLLWRAKTNGSLLGLHDKASILVVWRYSTAWVAGTLGGALFATKWLYHAVAKGRWHVDRRYWRYLTPHLSGGLAFGFYAIVSSSLLVIIDRARLQQGPTIVALAFLVGYFSDNATAALTRLADRVFGERDRDSQTEDEEAESGDTASESGESAHPAA